MKYPFNVLPILYALSMYNYVGKSNVQIRHIIYQVITSGLFEAEYILVDTYTNINTSYLN